MQIFFSYGHDDNQIIVERIKKDLEDLGYKVWIDNDELKSGDDWRRKITEAVINSDVMTSFASKHSVRDPGVCLNELMIAVAIKGAWILSVKLEPEVEPPKNASYKQFVDMSDWVEQKKKGKEQFENWYQTKIEEIVKHLNSKEIVQYNSEIELVKSQLRPDLSTAKVDRLKQEYYINRTWMVDEVKAWLSDETATKVLLIKGNPGSGKSAFMAHESLFNSYVCGILFCEWDHSSFNNLDSITRNLACQLAFKLPDYRLQLLSFLNDEKIRSGLDVYSPKNGESMFQDLILHRLPYLIDGERNLVILIDGIDELDGEYRRGGRRKNILAELLQKELYRFPRWLRFIITARNDFSVTKALKDVKVLDIDEHQEENEKAVVEYLRHDLEGYPTDSITEIVNNSSGNFLYAKMAAKAYKDGVDLDDIIKGDVGSLSYIYLGYFERMFASKDSGLGEDVLNRAIAALVSTDEPIPVETFQKIVGLSAGSLNKLVKLLSPYLTGMDRSGEKSSKNLSFFHKSICDWLLSDESDEFMVDKNFGVEGIARGCYQAYKESINNMNAYELRHLLYTIKQIGYNDWMDEILHNVQLAEVLMNFAQKERNAFRYDEAIHYAEDALSIYKTLNDYRSLQTYLFIAEVYDRMVYLDDAVDICKQAIVAAKGYENPEMIGDLYMRLAYILFRRSEWSDSLKSYENAFLCYERCVEYRKQMEVVTMKANVLRNLNRISDALACYENIEANPKFPNLEQENVNLLVVILTNYAWTLHDQEKDDLAIEMIEKAQEYIKEHRGEVALKDIAQVYYVWSIILFDLQIEYAKARDYCQMALERVKQVYGDNAVEICSALNQLAAIAQKQCNYPEAVRLFKKSYEIRLGTYGMENHFTLISLRNYAVAMIRNGNKDDYIRAEKILEDVDEARQKLFGKNGKAWVAQTKRDLAEYYKKVGDYKKAQEYILQAEKLYRQCDKNRDLERCLYLKGWVLYADDEKDAAKMAFIEARDLVKNVYRGNPDYLRSLETWISKCEQ